MSVVGMNLRPFKGFTTCPRLSFHPGASGPDLTPASWGTCSTRPTHAQEQRRSAHIRPPPRIPNDIPSPIRRFVSPTCGLFALSLPCSRTRHFSPSLHRPTLLLSKNKPRSTLEMVSAMAMVRLRKYILTAQPSVGSARDGPPGSWASRSPNLRKLSLPSAMINGSTPTRPARVIGACACQIPFHRMKETMRPVDMGRHARSSA